MRLRDLSEPDRVKVLESTKDTLQKVALMEASAAGLTLGPDQMAWVIGRGIKNALVQMRALNLLPEDFRFGDITVDYPKNVPQPVFRVEVQVIP